MEFEILSQNRQEVIFFNLMLPKYCRKHGIEIDDLFDIQYSHNSPKHLEEKSLEILHRITGADKEDWEKIQNRYVKGHGKSAWKLLVQQYIVAEFIQNMYMPPEKP